MNLLGMILVDKSQSQRLYRKKLGMGLMDGGEEGMGRENIMKTWVMMDTFSVLAFVDT